ncbi:MAG TPA: methyltransferase domain-containing protein [Vicinamibacterales bacterium]|nr:methyltransferase domain-containing protein [Vicinamibacterales bacterium]
MSRQERPVDMKRHFSIVILAAMLAPAFSHAQQPDARQIAQERKSAEQDAPKLVEVLELRPGMTVADVGSGGGAMAVVLGHWIGSGRVLATDVTESALRATREYVNKEGLTNVTVIEGAAAATNLPPACCEAIFLRNVYHHITEIDAFNKSLFDSLKPGGRLAIIDFVPRKGSPLPEGVPANREGHGIPPAVVIEEMKKAGLTYVRTIEKFDGVAFLTLFTR